METHSRKLLFDSEGVLHILRLPHVSQGVEKPRENAGKTGEIRVSLTTQQPWRREEGNQSFGTDFRTRASGSIQNRLASSDANQASENRFKSSDEN